MLPYAWLVDSELKHLGWSLVAECQVIIHDPLPKHSGREAAGQIDGGEDAHFLRHSVWVYRSAELVR